jgi:hypothetical protein
MRIAADGGGAATLRKEKTWIGHINTSPTQPHLLTFCHEGPWDLVDNRIWGLDLNTRKASPIRPREARPAHPEVPREVHRALGEAHHAPGRGAAGPRRAGLRHVPEGGQQARPRHAVMMEHMKTAEDFAQAAAHIRSVAEKAGVTIR